MNDDFQIQLGDMKTNLSIRQSPPPTEMRGLNAAVYADPSKSSLPVYISVNALDGIREHAASCGDREVGGALVGGMFTHRGKSYVRIDEFIQAKDAGEAKASLTFTHETWKQLNTELESRKSDGTIVGWYHTHPDFGVFLSEKDQFIHNNFFSSEGMVALVVDPVWSEWAFFHRVGEELSQCPGFWVFGRKLKDVDSLLAQIQPKPRTAQHVESPAPSFSASSRRGLIVAGIIFFVLLSILVGGVVSRVMYEGGLVKNLHVAIVSGESRKISEAAKAAFGEAYGKSKDKNYSGARILYEKLVDVDGMEKIAGHDDTEQKKWIRQVLSAASNPIVSDKAACDIYKCFDVGLPGGKITESQACIYMKDLAREAERIAVKENSAGAALVLVNILQKTDKKTFRLALLTQNDSATWNTFALELYDLANDVDQSGSHGKASQLFGAIILSYLKTNDPERTRQVASECLGIIEKWRDRRAVTNIKRLEQCLKKYAGQPQLSVDNKAGSEE